MSWSLTAHEAEFEILREAMSILELALWKNKTMELHPKLRSNARLRKRCLISCGAQQILENVASFLLEPYLTSAENLAVFLAMKSRRRKGLLRVGDLQRKDIVMRHWKDLD